MRLQPSRFFQVPLTLFVVSVVVLIAALMRFGGGAGAPLPAWAQASSCGNAIVEPPEQCDPPGNVGQCPGSPGGSFLPCNQDCTCPPPCSPTPENTSAACSDMMDNDCDGLIDCADPDCAGLGFCVPFRKDPTIITFLPGLDSLRGHGKFGLAAVDLTAEPVSILLTQPGATIYSGTLRAGALTPNATGTSFAYSNVAARTSGGIYSLKIKKNRDGSSYTVRFASYADLSAATDAHIRLQLYIGNDPNTAGDGRLFITSDQPWKQTPHGWRAPKDH